MECTSESSSFFEPGPALMALDEGLTSCERCCCEAVEHAWETTWVACVGGAPARVVVAEAEFARLSAICPALVGVVAAGWALSAVRAAAEAKPCAGPRCDGAHGLAARGTGSSGAACAPDRSEERLIEVKATRSAKGSGVVRERGWSRADDSEPRMIRDLMVHLDGGSEDDTRLSHVDALCRAFPGTRVTGLYMNPLPEYAGVFGVEPGLANAEAILDLERQLRAMGDETAGRLEERLRRYDAPYEMRRRDDWLSRLPAFAASQARWADLYVATLPRISNGHPWHAAFEAVLFESGRPVFVIPPGCPARRALRTVLLAWNDTAQAVRALNGALPLLRNATRVVVLVVDGRDRNDDRGASDLATHLDRHGVRAEVIQRQGSDAEAAAMIGKEAAKVSADLIVMGAYGHSRLREWVLGGATYDVMDAAEIPLLLAH